MRMDEFANNSQTQAKASMRPAFCGLCLSKAVEYPWQKLGLDALAVINHLNLGVRSRASNPNLNPPAIGCEFHGIR